MLRGHKWREPCSEVSIFFLASLILSSILPLATDHPIEPSHSLPLIASFPSQAAEDQMASEDKGASLDWETHEAQIRNLFISQNKTWKEVVAEMSEKHSFTATFALLLLLAVFPI